VTPPSQEKSRGKESTCGIAAETGGEGRVLRESIVKPSHAHVRKCGGRGRWSQKGPGPAQRGGREIRKVSKPYNRSSKQPASGGDSPKRDNGARFGVNRGGGLTHDSSTDRKLRSGQLRKNLEQVRGVHRRRPTKSLQAKSGQKTETTTGARGEPRPVPVTAKASFGRRRPPERQEGGA